MTRRLRFVQPDTTRIDLSDEDWIEIKTALDYGEMQTLRQAAFKPVPVNRDMDTDEMTVSLDPFVLQQKRMELYLTDWSFRDEADKPVPVTRTALRSLDPATADEINAAIVAHEAAEQAKKTTGGAPKSLVSSTSATPTDGHGQT